MIRRKPNKKGLTGTSVMLRWCLWMLCCWPVVLHGQPIDSCLQIAAANNKGLQAKYKAYEATLQGVLQANSLPDPQLSMGYFLQPVETRVGPQRARFSLSQVFPWFGTLSARESAASKAAEVAFQAFLDARNQLFLSVKTQYYALVEHQQQQKIMQENIALLTTYERLVQVRYENNQAGMVDLIRVQMKIADLETQLQLLAKKEKPLLSAFNALLQQPLSTPLTVPDSLPLLPVDTIFFTPNAIVQHPKVLALQAQAETAAAKQVVAQKEGNPRLGLGVDYVLTDNLPNSTLPENGQNVLMPMVTASVPIYRKKYKAQQTAAGLQQAQYTLAAAEMSTQLAAAYNTKRYSWEEAYANGQLHRQLISRAEQALYILTSAYANGEVRFEELLKMEEELLQHQLLFWRALTKQYIYQAELMYLTGQDL